MPISTSNRWLLGFSRLYCSSLAVASLLFGFQVSAQPDSPAKVFLKPDPTPEPQHALLPCRAAITGDPLELGVWSYVLQGLELDRSPAEKGGWPVARIVVIPGYEGQAEHALTIHLPDEGDAIVELATAKTGIRDQAYFSEQIQEGASPAFQLRLRPQPPEVALAVERRPLSRDLAQEISDVLFEAVQTAKYPDEPLIVLHPTTYHFVPWRFGVGFACARAEEPRGGTLAGSLKELFESLAAYSREGAGARGVRSSLREVHARLESRAASDHSSHGPMR